MKHIPYPHRTHPSGSALGKCIGSLCWILTITTLVFAGTRDWKSGRPLTTTLTDISDIQRLISGVEKAASQKAAKEHSIERASNTLERSLVEKGTLVRESSTYVETVPAMPQGLSRGR